MPEPPRSRLPPGAVKDYLLESILLLFCCAGVLAVPAILYAAQAKTRLARGDYEGAVQAAETARWWCLVGLFAGVVVNCTLLFLVGSATL